MKINNKLEEFNIVKDQKDQMIRDLSESLKAKVQENESLLQGINKLKQAEGQLKVQKDKIEGKFTELCENNKDLLTKNKDKETELAALRIANEKMMSEFIDEKNKLMGELSH